MATCQLFLANQIVLLGYRRAPLIATFDQQRSSQFRHQKLDKYLETKDLPIDKVPRQENHYSLESTRNPITDYSLHQKSFALLFASFCLLSVWQFA